MAPLSHLKLKRRIEAKSTGFANAWKLPAAETPSKDAGPKAESAYQRKMLKKSYRLTKQEIERLYKKGRAFPQDFVLVRFAANRANHCRFAVVIPKKVMAKATDRNRARREVYDFLAKQAALWQNKNLDISFSFRQFNDKMPEVLTAVFGKLS